MPECPPAGELRRYLEPDDAALDADRRQHIDVHVQVCSHCQELLDRWINDLEEELPRGRSVAPSSMEPQGAECKRFEDRMKDAGPPIPETPNGQNCTTETLSYPGSGFREGEQALGWPTVRGYEILSELGRGGMGVVYRALHRQLGRQVALKMIQSSSRALPEQLTRFETEAKAVARLNHNNIIQIYETGEAGRDTNGAEVLPYCAWNCWREGT